MAPVIEIFKLGLQDYLSIWESMRHYTHTRDTTRTDQIWFLEHFPVFTQGQARNIEPLLKLDPIPIISSDRGGQITYHGPGQLIAYLLFDLKRRSLSITQFVSQLEQSIVQTLLDLNLASSLRPEARGVYIDKKKIASVGLRVRQGYTYHGLALNVDMDLRPFTHIDPCGQKGLEMTQISTFIPDIKMETVQILLQKNLLAIFKT